MEIQIKDLEKLYAGKKVLEIPALDIKKGGFYGIIGPNGAGKSTLLKIIGGLEGQTRGSIYYDKTETQEQCVQKMTLVFQKPHLLRTTVFHNIAYPLILRKVAKKHIRRRVEELMEEMGLQNIRDRKAWTLSGGEAQKVALARALIFEPTLLLLDEPTANIDPASLWMMESMMTKTNGVKGTTILLVTHHLQQARRLCKELIFMDRGRVIEIGATEEIIYQPKDTITQKFIKGEILI